MESLRTSADWAVGSDSTVKADHGRMLPMGYVAVQLEKRVVTNHAIHSVVLWGCFGQHCNLTIQYFVRLNIFLPTYLQIYIHIIIRKSCDSNNIDHYL